MAGSPRLAGLLAGRIDPASLAALLVGLTAVAVIRTTLLPSVGSWDTGEAQAVPAVLGTMHPTGFPAYVVLGWLASILLQPLGSVAFRLNLLSAILVGVAAGGTAIVARRLGAAIPLAVAVALGFAATPIVWGIGTAADVHALHIALLVVLVLCLLRWERLVAERDRHPDDGTAGRRADRAIVLAAGVFGVAVANHALALLLVPAIGLYVLAVDRGALRRPRLVLAALGTSLGVAALLYLELPLSAGVLRAPLIYGHPETWGGFWDIVLARQFQGDVRGLVDLPARVHDIVTLASAELGPLILLVPIGMVVTAVRRPGYALLSITATVITCLFAASYANAAIDRYYLGPVFFAWTWLAVLGAWVVDAVLSAAGRLRPRSAAETAQGRVARSAPAWRRPRSLLSLVIGLALLVPTGLTLPTTWHQVDRSQETWVDTWLDEAFGAMEEGAVVISWWSYSTPLWYAQAVEGRRPDILVVDDRTRLDRGMGDVSDVIDTFLGSRPVYLMRLDAADIEALAARYAILPVGLPANLYSVTGRLDSGP